MTIPDNVPGWDFTTTNSPFKVGVLSKSMKSLVKDWEEIVGHPEEDTRAAARGTNVTFWYDASGDQHLPYTENIHGRYYSNGEIELAWVDGDTLKDTSWRHEWAHLFLYELEGDLDPNHLKCGGPWSEDVQEVVEK
jgi:hypothetical protein